jgi:uncharacterized protein
LKEISSEQSAIQNLNTIFFSVNGLLREEFSNLYPALLDATDYHLAIIRILAKKPSGMLKKDIINAAPFNDSSRIRKILQELIDDGFVSENLPFGNVANDKKFRLNDEYILFYLRFMEKNKYQEVDIWNMLSKTPEFKKWASYAFENICFKHSLQIKNALGISEISSTTSSYFKSANKSERSIQIDLLIDRDDNVINFVDIKFTDKKCVQSKVYSDKLLNKSRIFKMYTETNKMINWIHLSPFGVDENISNLGSVTQSLNLESFFKV